MTEAERTLLLETAKAIFRLSAGTLISERATGEALVKAIRGVDPSYELPGTLVQDWRDQDQLQRHQA